MTQTGPLEWQTDDNSVQKHENPEIWIPPKSEISNFRDLQGGILGAQKVKIYNNDIKENHNVVAKERYKDIINLNGSSDPIIIPENMETKKINAFTFDILT